VSKSRIRWPLKFHLSQKRPFIPFILAVRESSIHGANAEEDLLYVSNGSEESFSLGSMIEKLSSGSSQTDLDSINNLFPDE
jgi:hypothetical protein